MRMRSMGALWRIPAAIFLAGLVVITEVDVAPAQAAGTGTISGTVFQDLNRNGVQDPGEAPFTNEGLFLYDSNGAYVASAATDANGYYQFAGLPDGTYSVQFDNPSWTALRDQWVPTTTGTLYYNEIVNLSGSATANFGLRPIVRSTTPITTVTTAHGTVINSYDDVVTAQAIADDIATGSLFGAEAPLTTIDFDLQSASYYSGQIGGSPGNYSGFSATVYVGWDDWLVRQDFTLFYEYAHAWSGYYSYIVQQDPTLTSYLKARGLYGNSLLGSSLIWEPVELIADDYRQLFGSPTAAAFPQDNTQIPPANQVPGLKTFLSTTFMEAPTVSPPPPAPAGLSATAGEGQVGLAWPASSGATGYVVLRCSGAGCTPSTSLATTSATAFTDSSVANGTSYVYAVEASDSGGVSGPSPTATAMPELQGVTIGSLAVNPQPVTTSATIVFDLSAPASVTVEIENAKGRTVDIVLTGTTEQAGTVQAVWSVPSKVHRASYAVLVTATDTNGHTSSASMAFSVA